MRSALPRAPLHSSLDRWRLAGYSEEPSKISGSRFRARPLGLFWHLARLRLELRLQAGERTPVGKEFAMVGEGMLRALETFAWGPGAEAKRRGRKEGREEGALQAAHLTLERRFGPLPSPLQETFARARGPSKGEIRAHRREELVPFRLDGSMAAYLAEPKAEVARILGAGVHR